MRRLSKTRFRFHIVVYHAVALLATVVAITVCARAARIDTPLEQTASAVAPYSSAVNNR